MTIKHDMCQEWEVEIARLKLELIRTHTVIRTLCDMTINIVNSLKVMDENVEIEVTVKNINQLKEKYRND